MKEIPKIGLRETFELTTRNQYTKVSCELGVSIDGRELPSMAIVGKALEDCIALLQQQVTDSYKLVPERIAAVDSATAITTQS